MATNQDLDVARQVLSTEAAELHAAAESRGERFTAAVDRLAGCTGRIVVSGMGKSGHVARKIATTLASTDFRQFHPGGRFGARRRRVRELVRDGDALPLADPDVRMGRALFRITERRFGCLGVTDRDGKLVRVLTDGDPRRAMGPDLLSKSAGDIVTRAPRTIGADEPAAVALRQRPRMSAPTGIRMPKPRHGGRRPAIHDLRCINRANRGWRAFVRSPPDSVILGRRLSIRNAPARPITALFVVDDDARPVGILHIHDLLRAGVV